MTKILIANLGNRNIKLQGKILDNSSFRSKTKEILENFDQHKDDITIEIINKVTTDANQYTRMVLVATDQDQSVPQHVQDTLYEAEIIKKLFEEEIDGTPVSILRIAGNPADIDNCLAQYRTAIADVLAAHPDAQFVYVNAGGTHQMKSALRMLLQYTLPPDRLDIQNVSETDGAALHDSKWEQHYSLLDFAAKLALKQDFSGALAALQASPKKDHLSRIATQLQLANSIKHLQPWGEFLHSMPRLKPELTVLSKEVDWVAYHRKGKYEIPKNIQPLFAPDAQADILLLASRAKHELLSNEDTTLGVTLLYRLIEEMGYAHAMVAHEGVKRDMGSEVRAKFAKQIGKAFHKKSNPFGFIPNAEPQWGVPLLAAHLQQNAREGYRDAKGNKITANPLSQRIANSLQQLLFPQNDFQKGLGAFRNVGYLAHRTRPIVKATVEAKIKGLFPNPLKTIRPNGLLEELLDILGILHQDPLLAISHSLANQIRSQA